MRKIDGGGDTTAVTFVLPAGMTDGEVSVGGDFNDWEPGRTALCRQDDGSYEVAGRLLDLTEGERGLLGLYLSTQPLAA